MFTFLLLSFSVVMYFLPLLLRCYLRILLFFIHDRALRYVLIRLIYTSDYVCVCVLCRSVFRAVFHSLEILFLPPNFAHNYFLDSLVIYGTYISFFFLLFRLRKDTELPLLYYFSFEFVFIVCLFRWMKDFFIHSQYYVMYRILFVAILATN